MPTIVSTTEAIDVSYECFGSPATLIERGGGAEISVLVLPASVGEPTDIFNGRQIQPAVDDVAAGCWEAADVRRSDLARLPSGVSAATGGQLIIGDLVYDIVLLKGTDAASLEYRLMLSLQR